MLFSNTSQQHIMTLFLKEREKMKKCNFLVLFPSLLQPFLLTEEKKLAKSWQKSSKLFSCKTTHICIQFQHVYGDKGFCCFSLPRSCREAHCSKTEKQDLTGHPNPVAQFAENTFVMHQEIFNVLTTGADRNHGYCAELGLFSAYFEYVVVLVRKPY